MKKKIQSKIKKFMGKCHQRKCKKYCQGNINMRKKQYIEKKILKIAEKILSCTTFDRLLIERRRRIHKVTGFYPEAVFLSKKKSEKKYCIVRYRMPVFGLVAAGIQYVFCYYLLAERGYIPILDIEYTYSFKQGRIGEYNIWDACFKQPISAKEAATQPYVLAAGELFDYSNDPQICLALNDDIKDHFIHVRKENFREYYAKAQKYVEPIWQVKNELLTELDEEIWNKVNGCKILGVFLRENFSKDVFFENREDQRIYSNHPLLPGVRETIEIIKSQLSVWEYDYIFLSTIYIESLQQFKDAFEDRVIYIERPRMSIKDKRLANFGMSEKETYEMFNLNLTYHINISQTYIKEIVALSRCTYLLGGASSGMAAALVMNGGQYEDIHILEDARKIQRY